MRRILSVLRRKSCRQPQAGLLARSWQNFYHHFYHHFYLPRSTEPSGFVRSDHSPYSGGTAPALHRTSLLGPIGHLKNPKPSMPKPGASIEQSFDYTPADNQRSEAD
jgi:hypothetical protein